jgi:hypothetical protein
MLTQKELRDRIRHLRADLEQAHQLMTKAMRGMQEAIQDLEGALAMDDAEHETRTSREDSTLRKGQHGRGSGRQQH